MEPPEQAAPPHNPDDDNVLIQRLKRAYSDSALAAVRPAHWSAAIGSATAAAGALLLLMRATVPPVAAASCAAGALGYGYAYTCFGADAGAARRAEGFQAGLGTSALVASGQLAAFRGSGANPLLLNVLLLSSASALYYSGLAFSEKGALR